MTQIILAYTRKDVASLNNKARELLQAQGVLRNAKELIVKNREGEESSKAFAVNERVYFIKNDKQLGVKNGSLGKIVKIQGKTLSILLDTGTTVAFSLDDYAYLDHGYAATIHKAQGITVDNVYFLADKYLDRHATYVAATRHRRSLEIHYDTETFTDKQKMYSILSRDKPKDMVLDYIEARGFGSEQAVQAQDIDGLGKLGITTEGLPAQRNANSVKDDVDVIYRQMQHQVRGLSKELNQEQELGEIR